MGLSRAWAPENWMVFVACVDYHLCLHWCFFPDKKHMKWTMVPSTVFLWGAFPLMPATKSILEPKIHQHLLSFFFIFWHMYIKRQFFWKKICHTVTTYLPHVALASVFGESVTHSYLTGLFCNTPRDEVPFWIQNTKSYKILETAFNIFQALLIFSPLPVLIHKPCMRDIQEGALKSFFPVKKKCTFIQPTFRKHQDCRKYDTSLSLRIHNPEEELWAHTHTQLFICLLQNVPK